MNGRVAKWMMEERKEARQAPKSSASDWYGDKDKGSNGSEGKGKGKSKSET